MEIIELEGILEVYDFGIRMIGRSLKLVAFLFSGNGCNFLYNYKLGNYSYSISLRETHRHFSL